MRKLRRVTGEQWALVAMILIAAVGQWMIGGYPFGWVL